MERISAFTDLVTPSGAFRYGTAAGGVPPTPVKAEWLNLVQAELVNFILAYLPALDALDNEQLLKAARQLIANLAVKATTLGGYGIGDAYTKNQTDFLLSNKANWGITLAAYGIGDAYTKTAVDGLLAGKANNAITLAGYGIGDAYTKSVIDAALAAKQNKNTALMAATGWHLDTATGLLEQWGTGVCGPDTTTAPINFPTPFAEVYNCFGNKITTNSVDADGNSAGAFATSATQYRLFNDTNLMAVTVHWRAIGKAPGY